MKELLTLRRYFRPYRTELSVGVAALMLCNLLELAIPGILAYALGTVARMAEVKSFQWEPLVASGLWIVALTAVRVGLSFTQRRCIGRTSRNVERDIRREIFSHLTQLSPSYFTQARTGDIIARATNDLNAVREVAGMGIMYSMDAINKLVGVTIILMLVDARITLLTLVPLLGIPVLSRMFGGKIRAHFTKVQEKFSDLNTQAQENFGGARVVKSFAQEANEIDRFEKLSGEYAARNIRLARIRSLLFSVFHSVASLAICISIYYGGTAAIGGGLSRDNFFKFVFYVPMLIWPMFAAGFITLVFQTGSASMRRINHLLSEEPTIADAPDCVTFDRVAGEIAFRDFSFTYAGATEPALRNIDLAIPAGSTLAIIGPTGSGKSTLVTALARLLEVEGGQIFVDGQDITQVSLRSLRKQIGYVPQDTFLFSETVRENIAFGFAGPPDGAVERAAQVSRLSNDIDQLPDGYDSLLGERGVNLSGGQKQRAAIARAVILDPPILILDDCLSAVDTYTESEILKEIAGVMENRTSIIISHRVSALKNADRIIVLDDGAIVETGTHEALVRKKGVYAKIHRKQQLESELEMLK